MYCCNEFWSKLTQDASSFVVLRVNEHSGNSIPFTGSLNRKNSLSTGIKAHLQAKQSESY